MLAGNKFWQIFCALFGRAVTLDLIDTEIGMRAIAQANRRRRAADFFHGNTMSEIAHTSTAIVFRSGDPKHTKLTQFTPEIHGKCIVAVGVGSKRRNAAFRKTAHSIPKGFDLLAKTEVHARCKHTRPPQVLPGCCF